MVISSPCTKKRGTARRRIRFLRTMVFSVGAAHLGVGRDAARGGAPGGERIGEIDIGARVAVGAGVHVGGPEDGIGERFANLRLDQTLGLELRQPRGPGKSWPTGCPPGRSRWKQWPRCRAPSANKAGISTWKDRSLSCVTANDDRSTGPLGPVTVIAPAVNVWVLIASLNCTVSTETFVLVYPRGENWTT